MLRQLSKLFTASWGLVFLCCMAMAAEIEETKPATLEELQAAIQVVLEEQKVPAASIVMADQTGPVWVGALGKANIENDVDADEDTMFRIGSVSKMFVALAILKLQEEDRLSLDDKLADLAPEIAYTNPWEDTDPIRIVHLLEHTTGWEDIHLVEFAHNDPTPSTLKEGLDFHPHSRVSRWKPGSRMSYCNSGPPVAAYIIERITGQDFEAYVAENFFEPMGMDTMTYRLTPDVANLGATLYAGDTDPVDYWHILMRPAGSINASARDMARFLDFYLQRGAVAGKQLVSEASLKRMETAVSSSGARAGLEVGYGLYNYSSPHEQWVYREHNGGMQGGLAELSYLPEAGLGHVIMINSDNGRALRQISGLIRGFATRDLPVATIEKEIDVTQIHREIEGLYTGINPRNEFSYFLERILAVQRVWFEGNKLAVKRLLGGEARYFFPVSETQYKSAKTGLVSLVQTEDPLAGDVLQTRGATLKPVSGLQVYGSLAIAVLWGLSIASSLLFFLVWLTRKLRGKIPPGATIRIRVWPLLASVSVLGVIGLVTFAETDPFGLLGRPSAVSIGITVVTIAFALFALLGTYTCISERNTQMNRANYWHSTLASFTHLIIAVYLTWFGVIGVMMWA